MADSLIGFLNQQIQKTNRAQEQQQHQSTSTTTGVTNTPTHYTSNTPAPTTSNQSTFLRSSESQLQNPGRSQNTYSDPFSAQECISSLGGLGINNTQIHPSNTVVSGATSISSGNVLPNRGCNIYPNPVRIRGESMLLQQQPTSVHLSSQFSSQSNKPINMSSSGILLNIS